MRLCHLHSPPSWSLGKRQDVEQIVTSNNSLLRPDLHTGVVPGSGQQTLTRGQLSSATSGPGPCNPRPSGKVPEEQVPSSSQIVPSNGMDGMAGKPRGNKGPLRARRASWPPQGDRKQVLKRVCCSCTSSPSFDSSQLSPWDSQNHP